MADKTEIQWCDSAVNPVMGCAECELLPKPGQVLDAVDEAVRFAAGDMEKNPGAGGCASTPEG